MPRFSGLGTSSAAMELARTTIGERACTRVAAFERTSALKEVRCTRVLASIMAVLGLKRINWSRQSQSVYPVLTLTPPAEVDLAYSIFLH